MCQYNLLLCLLQILFLNKVDLFRDKIMNSKRHLRLYFSQYTGEVTVHFVFVMCAQELYCHLTAIAAWVSFCRPR